MSNTYIALYLQFMKLDVFFYFSSLIFIFKKLLLEVTSLIYFNKHVLHFCSKPGTVLLGGNTERSYFSVF